MFYGYVVLFYFFLFFFCLPSIRRTSQTLHSGKGVVGVRVDKIRVFLSKTWSYYFKDGPILHSMKKLKLSSSVVVVSRKNLWGLSVNAENSFCVLLYVLSLMRKKTKSRETSCSIKIQLCFNLLRHPIRFIY